MPNGRQGRATVGVLVGWQVYQGTLHSFLELAFQGIQTAAKDHGCNLLMGCGVGRVASSFSIRPAWPTLADDSDFVPVGVWNTDALIVVNPLLSAARSQNVHNMIAQGHPVVFLGAGEDGPSVVPDNAAGIRQAIDHLVSHGHRRIAFMAGEAVEGGDSGQRLDGYRAALAAHGLPEDPRLLAYGYHTFDGSFQAMERIIASGAEFTAVVGSNDENAIGAMRALRHAGRRVPDDVAVIGFDDRPDASIQSPSLTTVRYPAYAAGYQALTLALQSMETPLTGAPTIQVPTQLIIRQLCGCVPGAVAEASLPEGNLRSAESASPVERVARAIGDAVVGQAGHLSPEEIKGLSHQLAGAFQSALLASEPATFYRAMGDVLQRVEALDDSAHAWQAGLSLLASGVDGLLNGSNGPVAKQQAAQMLDRGRIMISDSSRRQYRRMVVAKQEFADRNGVLAARFFASLEEDVVLDVLREALPGIGIRHGQVIFYEAEAEDPVAWGVLRGEAGGEGRRFATRQFPPPGLYSDDEPTQLALLPLVMSDAVIGCVAFDAGNLEPCSSIVRQLAAALTGARLYAEVRQLSLTDSLTGLHNRRYFELFFHNELDRSQRYAQELSLLMVDIDHFKDYNDTFGHPAGDEALRQVSRCLAAEARRGLDVVARYGGEEFVIILPGVDASGARMVAERIRACLATNTQLLRKVTVSVGYATVRGDSAEALNVLEWADRALYQAKRSGRDRAAVFVPELLSMKGYVSSAPVQVRLGTRPAE